MQWRFHCKVIFEFLRQKIFRLLCEVGRDRSTLAKQLPRRKGMTCALRKLNSHLVSESEFTALARRFASPRAGKIKLASASSESSSSFTVGRFAARVRCGSCAGTSTATFAPCLITICGPSDRHTSSNSPNRAFASSTVELRTSPPVVANPVGQRSYIYISFSVLIPPVTQP